MLHIERLQSLIDVGKLLNCNQLTLADFGCKLLCWHILGSTSKTSEVWKDSDRNVPLLCKLKRGRTQVAQYLQVETF